MTFDPPLEHLSCTRDDAGVVTLRLDYPARRNAMSAPMTESWVRAIDALRTDRDVRCVVVTGAGDAFCSGGDHAWLAETAGATVDDSRNRMLPFYRAWLSIRDLEVPTIAAINGPAVGAGMCLALATDLRYAAHDATMSVPFTRLGLHPGMTGTWLLPQVAGLSVAREMFLTGRVISGEEAASMGVVNRSFPAEDLAAEVAAIASAVAACAPIPTRLTKVALAGGGHRDHAAAIQWEALAQPISMATEDLAEGLAAARERRRPQFKGR
ncbi:MAG: enoyl-CoA hydratase/isomerase family protein [Sporichthyaceae bacterium]|jgi:enoyl-CoA hydratase